MNTRTVFLLAMAVCFCGCAIEAEHQDNVVPAQQMITGMVEVPYANFLIREKSYPQPINHIVVSVFSAQAYGVQNARLIVDGAQICTTAAVIETKGAIADGYFIFDLSSLPWNIPAGQPGSFTVKLDASPMIDSGTTVALALLADYSTDAGVQPSITAGILQGPASDAMGPTHFLYDTNMKIFKECGMTSCGGRTVAGDHMTLMSFRVLNSVFGTGEYPGQCLEIHHSCESPDDTFEIYDVRDTVRPIAVHAGDGILEPDETVCFDFSEIFPPGTSSQYLIRGSFVGCQTLDYYSVVVKEFIWMSNGKLVNDGLSGVIPFNVNWDF